MQAAMNQPLVLLSCGSPDQIAELQQQAAPTLAAALGLPLAPALGHGPASVATAAQELAAAPAQALIPLLLDPGLALDGGGHWAEALGAARQCCLLLISADQLRGGNAAAGNALLRQWRVPLLGLVQADGSWDEEARRRDGLPWLGLLGSAPLVAAARVRWPLLQAELR
jgi:hypothetical protein